MIAGSQWNTLAAQQLVRYVALFELIDDIQTLEDIPVIATRVAMRWKYFANVMSWRLVVPKDGGFYIIDGCQGKAGVVDAPELSPWDAYHYTLQRPCLIRRDEPWQGPEPPTHLRGNTLFEIEVLPLIRGKRCIALLSAAAHHEPFSNLDQRFIRMLGNYFTDRVSDILLRRQATGILINKATRDELTGLLNRGTIIERLGNQLALAKRSQQALSVILADIDWFKTINDSYGHLAGDAVLREVARRLQVQTREGDQIGCYEGNGQIGRYGGEEFLFVLFPCGAEEIPRAAERLRRAIADTPISIGGETPRDLRVTISLGTASTSGQDDIRMEALLKQADDALYLSKASGRNRVTVNAGGAAAQGIEDRLTRYSHHPR